MTSNDLKSALASLQLSLAEFANLVGVTPRAVSLWLSGERSVPGPVDAYLRVVSGLPQNLKIAELSNRTKESIMRDGMFLCLFTNNGQDYGQAILVFDNGRIFGVDTGPATYDGQYTYDVASKRAACSVKVKFPPNTTSIFGLVHPYEWSIDVDAMINPHADADTVSAKTTLGPVQAEVRYLRPLPMAA